MQRFAKLASLVLALFLVFVPTSCLVLAAGAAGAAGAAWYMGELKATLDGNPPEVARAAEKALESMSMKVDSTTSSDLDGKITAHSALDKQITIHIERSGDHKSKIGIRVGTMGDEEQSRAILERIQKKL
jgi:hypothetical protein